MFKPLEKVEIPEEAKRRIRIEEGHFDFEKFFGIFKDKAVEEERDLMISERA